MTEPGETPPEKHAPDEVYTYAAAGIGERQGNVPLWLWAVVISLSVWGIYYLCTYWNPS